MACRLCPADASGLPADLAGAFYRNMEREGRIGEERKYVGLCMLVTL